jgi:hypothetical protein
MKARGFYCARCATRIILSLLALVPALANGREAESRWMPIGRSQLFETAIDLRTREYYGNDQAIWVREIRRRDRTAKRTLTRVAVSCRDRTYKIVQVLVYGRDGSVTEPPLSDEQSEPTDPAPESVAERVVQVLCDDDADQAPPTVPASNTEDDRTSLKKTTERWKRPKRPTDAQIKQRLIDESVAAYMGAKGNCPCPYNLARNGSVCGKRSAWNRPGGEEPLCFPSDVSAEMVREYRLQHEGDRSR